MPLHATAPAKLNLYLHIVGKRDDGYHLLDSLVAFTEFGDEVSVQAADSLALNVSGEFAVAAGNIDDNLVMRAARALQQATGCKSGAAISLEKRIPVGAGLGGGSSDAATVAWLLNQLWGLNLSDAALTDILAPLGADMSVCVSGKAMIMHGIGDELLPAPALPNYSVLLVNPMKRLLTQEVYGTYAGDYRDLDESCDLLNMHNDLTAAAISLCPEVEQVLNLLEEQNGALISRMCGSGATCFALFDDDALCKESYQKVTEEKTDWWAVSTCFR